MIKNDAGELGAGYSVTATGNLLIGPVVHHAGEIQPASVDMGTSSMDEVLRMANEGRGADVHGYRGESIKLVEQYRYIGQGWSGIQPNNGTPTQQRIPA